ncbi:MAG: M48 family metallopeptidase [Lachnospiraceae bacterium]|nr:M48 family metallopeptidase [Lachnospiraceae bacterium]
MTNQSESTIRIQYQSKLYELPYTLIRSNRRSFSISISPDGQITVRVPMRATQKEISHLLIEKRIWIVTKYLEVQEKQRNRPVSELTDTQRLALEKRYIAAAKEYFPKRVAHFHQFTGGSYNRITIRDQKTRWGSCSARGTLSFNWRLMLAPPAILDYVVVHELCHLTHMNHSAAFWQKVESVYPDYRTARKWLKDHGQELVL